MIKILLVDDEKNILRVVSLNLIKRGFLVDTAISAEQGFNLFLKNRYDIILCDLKLEGMNGIELLSKVRNFDKRVIFIIITAFGSIEQAVYAIKMGANDFISKPVDIEGLSENLKVILNKNKGEKLDNSESENEESDYISKIKENFIFESPVLAEILHEAYLAAEFKSNILITGETGTGKELVARIMHDLSGRRGEFVPINCSAVPIDLMENEFFGHEKGSFTGAISRQIGKFETAEGGTLFLDEIGDMPLFMQAKLLRVIQDKEFSRIGSNEKIKLNARIICATNIELERAVIEKKFREDLFYRINVLHFKIPRLRERKEDIAPLANFFVKKYGKLNKKNIKSISEEAIKILMDYAFPGNIRELENFIERAVIVSPYDVLEPSSLPKTITSGRLENKDDENIISLTSDNLRLEDVEIYVIKNALEKNDYNQTKSAITLGISRKQLITKMKKYNLFG
ncbi:sigma-54-dependent transcriptional regulator [Candidatus Acidulodesulfobacterium sp. H_13]|uniref:sigma-54-dependent transcriptional regulator n=1 Tax=Candidatus Acidulodesulfobacterium sp. H_13 TaxID=3395470 RepID=UPI003AF9CC2D